MAMAMCGNCHMWCLMVTLRFTGCVRLVQELCTVNSTLECVCLCVTCYVYLNVYTSVHVTVCAPPFHSSSSRVHKPQCIFELCDDCHIIGVAMSCVYHYY